MKISKRLSTNIVREFVESFGYKLLTEFESSSVKIKVSCPLNHVYEVKFNNFKQGRRCKECSYLEKAKKFKHSLEHVKKTFLDNDCIPLFSNYKNAKTPLLYMCNCGNKSTIRFSDFQRGKRCKLCMGERLSDRFRFSYSYVEKLFEINDCKLLSDKYINGKEHLDYVCSCGNRDVISFEKFKLGQRCYECRNNKISKSLKGRNFPERRGENHPNWKYDKSDEDRVKERKFYDYHQWRESVFERDNFTCQCCSKVGHELNAHHLDGWNWCIEKRLDVDNGITLCKICHDEFHEMYGKGNNTKEQFMEFLFNKRRKLFCLI